MKLLMFDTNDFWYKPFSKTVESAENYDEEESTKDSLVIFINVEKEDEIRKDKVIKRLLTTFAGWLKRQIEKKQSCILLDTYQKASRASSSPKNPLKQLKTN